MTLQKSACIECMYQELPFLERFQAAAADGFPFVEFWSWEDKDLSAVQEASERAGVGIAAFNGDASYSLVNPAHRTAYQEFLHRSAETARQIGARSLTIHSNALGPGGMVADRCDGLSAAAKLVTLYDGLCACAKLAEATGIRMNLEPLNTVTDHPGNFLTSSQTAAELTAMVGSPLLKMLFDVYHMQLQEGDLCGHLRACGSQLGHVHVADAPGRHEPGTGEINYHRIFSCLEEIGYRGLIGFELYPKNTTQEAVWAIHQY